MGANFYVVTIEINTIFFRIEVKSPSSSLFFLTKMSFTKGIFVGGKNY